MSKAWDALSEYDRNYLLDYVAGHHTDELGIVQQIGEGHADPDVRAAAEDARRALKRAAAFVARRYEGDIGRELERRRGEFAVGLLARVLGLVPRATALRELNDYAAAMQDEIGKVMDGFMRFIGSHAAAIVAAEHVGIDGTTPRVPVPDGWVYLGRVVATWPFDVATIHGKLSFSTADESHDEDWTLDAECYRHSDGTNRDRNNPMRSDHRDAGLALYDRYLESRR